MEGGAKGEGRKKRDEEGSIGDRGERRFAAITGLTTLQSTEYHYYCYVPCA